MNRCSTAGSTGSGGGDRRLGARPESETCRRSRVVHRSSRRVIGLSNPSRRSPTSDQILSDRSASG